LELVGPVRDFSQIHPVGKLIFSLLMAMGRLELLSLLVLFVPSFWRKAIHRTS
jgi:trk system potassium uptake protein TrkH